MPQFLHMVDYIHWVIYYELSLLLENEAYLIIMDNHFNLLLDLVSKYFIQNFCLCGHKHSWSIILLIKSLCGLVIRV